MTTSPPRRLLFIISAYSSSNTGNGGHYYSLRELSTTFASAWPETVVQILCIGDIDPPPLRDCAVAVTRVSFAGVSPMQFVRAVIRSGVEFGPSHVHSFDNKSHFFGRMIARQADAKVYLTKPGGPNPGPYFPYAPDVICFSRENLDNLAPRPWLSGARFHFIPQRVSKPRPDALRVAELSQLVGEGPILLRICRIGGYYRAAMKQTLALGRLLRSHDIPTKTVILGTLEDKSVLDELQAMATPEDYFITDPRFTRNAAELIPIAQAVVGTGRGLVEAALLGKPVFTPLASSETPVLVTPENWRELAATNFSERNQLTSGVPSLEETLATFATGQSNGSAEVAAEMGLDAALVKYLNIYSAPQSLRYKPVDLALNSASMALPLLRALYGSTRRKSPART